MKDLIAKLQLDANCAMGAIWMHIDAQAARIAELEAQIAAASAPDVEQKNLRALYLEEAAAKVEEMVEGIGDRAAYDHREMYDSETERMHAAIDFAAGIRSLIPASAPQAADTDKLREVIKYSYELRVAIENAAAGYGEFIDPGLAETIGKEIITYLAASTALQAPVREVQGWQPIETAPKDGTEILLWLPAPYNRIAKARWFDLWENWQEGEFPSFHDEYCGIGSSLPTHYMPLPADPVQEQKP